MTKVSTWLLPLALICSVLILDATVGQASDKPEGSLADGPQSDGLRRALLRGAALVARADQMLNEAVKAAAPQAITYLTVTAADVSFDVHVDQITYRPPRPSDPEYDGSIEFRSPSGHIYSIELGMVSQGPRFLALIRRLLTHGRLQINLPKAYRISDSRNYHGIGGVTLTFETQAPHAVLAVLRAFEKRSGAETGLTSSTCRQLFARHQ